MHYGDVRTKSDIRLFPNIMRSSFHEGDVTEGYREWLSTYLRENPFFVDKVWENAEDRFLDERFDVGGPLPEFQAISRTFPILLAKYEIRKIKYLYSLCRCLKNIPKEIRRYVLVTGPTFGGEVEAVEYAGGYPFFWSGYNLLWGHVAEERLFYDSVDWETIAYEEDLGSEEFHCVILSQWAADQAKMVRIGYDSLRDFGFLIFPDRTISMSREAETLGMKRDFTSLPNIRVYCKNIGMKRRSGEIDVHQ